MCCGSSDTSFFCAACSRAWACSSRSRRSLYSLFHASFVLSNSSTSAILRTVLGSFGGGFSCCQRSPSSRTRRTFFSAFLSSSMLARISTSLCVGPLFIGPPLVTSGVGHLTLRGPLRRSGDRQAPSSVLRATRRPQARSPWPGRLFSRIIPRNRALPFGVSWVVWTGPIRGFTQRRGYGVPGSSFHPARSGSREWHSLDVLGCACRHSHHATMPEATR